MGKCRCCGTHASRVRPCKQCRKNTCYSCTIESMCPDCWTDMNARRIALKDTRYFDQLLKELKYDA